MVDKSCEQTRVCKAPQSSCFSGGESVGHKCSCVCAFCRFLFVLGLFVVVVLF